MEKQEKRFTFVYQRSVEYREIPVSGIWGSVTPQGMLHAQIFIEHSTLPDKETLVINEIDGSISEHITEGEQVQMREVLVGLTMRPEIARSIGTWMIQQADEFDDLIKKAIPDGLKK